MRAAGEAGLAGCTIEDTTRDAASPIHDFDHAVARIRAAVQAARALGRPFVLTARAENFLNGRPDLDDTIRRLVAFAEVGADCLYAPFLPDMDAIRQAVAAVAPKPVNVLAGPAVGLRAAGDAGGGRRAARQRRRAAGARRLCAYHRDDAARCWRATCRAWHPSRPGLN